MTQKELKEITDKIIKLADEKSEIDSYNKGYIDGLYQALRVFRTAYFGENPKEEMLQFIKGGMDENYNL